MFKFATQPTQLAPLLKDSVRLYKETWSKLWYWAAIAGAVNAIAGYVFPLYLPKSGFSFTGLLLMLLANLGTVFIFAFMIHRVYLKGTQQDLSVKESIKLAWKKLFSSFIASEIMALIVILGIFVFIFPGIYFLILFVFYLPNIVIDNFKIFSSFKQSGLLIHKKWIRTCIMIFIPLLLSLIFIVIKGFWSDYQSIGLNILLNVIISMIFMPYYVSTLMVQFNDLKLRKQIKDEKATIKKSKHQSS